MSGAGVVPPSRLYTIPPIGVVTTRLRKTRQACAGGGQCVQHAVWDAGRSSPIGNPFADDHQRCESVTHAYDDWLALVLWFGMMGRLSEAKGLVQLIARRHAVAIYRGKQDACANAAWSWLWRAALQESEITISGPGGDSSSDRLGGRFLDSVAGAVAWLRQNVQSGSQLRATVPLKAGDWAVAHIYARWPAIAGLLQLLMSSNGSLAVPMPARRLSWRASSRPRCGEHMNTIGDSGAWR